MFFKHFAAVFIKRFHYSKRDKKGFFCEIMLPIIMVIFGLAIMTIKFIKESPSLII